MCLVRQFGNLQRVNTRSVESPIGSLTWALESGSFADSHKDSQKAQECKADDPHSEADHITTEP
jgi:hypothetical protein